MAKRDDGLEGKLARLRALERESPPTAVDEIAKLLEDKSPFVAARAAEVAEQLAMTSLREPLLATLRRVLDGQQADTGCRVAAAVLGALAKLEVEAADEYLRAMKLVRRERHGTGYVDSAIPVRLRAAEALATSRRATAVLDIVTLFGDEESEVRAGAAAVLGMFRADAALAALYAKLLSGDASPDVLGACMAALARADSARFVPVVATYLDSEDDTLAELAAVALGDSRAAAALPLLRATIERGTRGRRQSTLLLAVSLLRTDGALDYLIEVVRRGAEPAAIAALQALRIHAELPSLGERVREAVEARRSKKLSQAFRAGFDRAT